MRWANGRWYVDVARVVYLLLGVFLGDQVRPLEHLFSDVPPAASAGRSVVEPSRGTAAESENSVHTP